MRSVLYSFCVFGLFGNIGCVTPNYDFSEHWQRPQSKTNPGQWPGCINSKSSSHVIILPGILGGSHSSPQSLKRCIERSRQDISVQIWDWRKLNSTESPLTDLKDDKLNRLRAKVFAKRMAEWYSENPDKKLYLVGMSGGARIVFFVCEDSDLPAGFSFEKIVLLSGAVPTNWDTGSVIRKASKGVFNYCSRKDNLLRWLFTRTIGKKGYRNVPLGVKQLRWGSKMRKKNNRGRHLQCVEQPFCGECVAPLFKHNTLDWQESCRNMASSD